MEKKLIRYLKNHHICPGLFKMKLKRIIIIGLLAIIQCNLRSQDIHFSQIQESPLFISPAYTGFFNGYYRAIANYRTQWSAMGNPFKTMALQLDGGFFKNKKRNAFIGGGLTVYNDAAGIANFSILSVGLNVSGILKLSNQSAFSVGLCGGPVTNNANYPKLIFSQQYNGEKFDETLPTGESYSFRKLTYTDVGAGLAYEFVTKKISEERDYITSVKFGVGAYHLNSPKLDYTADPLFYRLPVRYTFHATGLFDITGTAVSIMPNVLYQIQRPARQLNLGTHVLYRFKNGTKITGEKKEIKIGLGMYYRTNDAFIAQVLFDMGVFAINVAYDYNISPYKIATKGTGGYEISLRYNKLADALFAKKSEYKNTK
ncbi:MAG: PorP/SprF family type IX secretion system membrane protein [Bacteroidia bacterium]|nr:PorP/SprF family type IX secretion system membrane protein [Bacteroidia bacterium]